MQAVGIRKLKARASELVRRVREDHETIEVTYRGRAVARLVPIEQPRNTDMAEFGAIWADMDRLAEEISALWPAGVSATDAIDDVRRDFTDLTSSPPSDPPARGEREG